MLAKKFRGLEHKDIKQIIKNPLKTLAKESFRVFIVPQKKKQLAVVLPKKHLKKASARNKLKRQMISAIERSFLNWTGTGALVILLRAKTASNLNSKNEQALNELVRKAFNSILNLPE